ncbi:guanylate kinase [Arboricoccus pini]|nr:guanylate kinase [Arboricoccus pini]
MSSPSGAGKTSLSRRLLETEDELSMSVSVTTRPARPGEIDGTHYFFIKEEEFDRMALAGELLEHAHVYGHRYGTPRKAVEQALSQGRDVLFDIDWQGAQQLREAAADDMVGVFILPPDRDELARRLRTRAQDSDAVVAYRMTQVSADVTHWAEYDYVLVNAEFEASLWALRSVLMAERLKRRRQPGLTEFVRRFREPQA